MSIFTYIHICICIVRKRTGARGVSVYFCTHFFIPWAPGPMGPMGPRGPKGPMGPMDPWAPWAHGPHGHMGPMCPWAPWALYMAL